MYRLIDAPKTGWTCIHVDAESIREPVNFIIALLDALLADQQVRKFLLSSWKTMGRWIRNLLPEIELATPWDLNVKIKFKESIRKDWQDRGECLLGALRQYPAKLLIIIDELPVMLYLFRDNDVSDSEARTFLYWFRKLRTDPGVGLTDCRFLVGGSIGIVNYLSQLNATDSFNDFERLSVSELSAPCAADFIDRLLKSRKVSLSLQSRKRILELIGTPIPYFIQVFVSEIASEWWINDVKKIGPKRIEDIYHHRVLGGAGKTYFQHYYDRLRHYDKSQEQAAKALLKELARVQPGLIHAAQLRVIYKKALGETATNDGFDRLIGDLENDFYIRYLHEDDGYAFVSTILCDWWRRYYAF